MRYNSLKEMGRALKPIQKPVKQNYKVVRLVMVLNDEAQVSRFLKKNTSKNLFVIKQ